MPVVESPDEFIKHSFDYIIIGGGTAGLALAGRLSERPHLTVGVVEAGAAKLNDPSILTPAAFSTIVGNKDYDWLLKTVPQPGTKNLVHAFPRGKVLGGSSAINYMMYVRGQATEYNDWARITGYQLWSWAGLKPYFLKHESLTVPVPSADHDDAGVKTKVAFDIESHGSSGPIKTSFGNWSAPVEDLWHRSSVALGLQWAPPKDAWSGTHLGGYSNLSTIDRSQGPGTRSYSVTGYFVPNARRPNLLVLTEALVARIMLRQDKKVPIATGVVFLRNGTEYVVEAKREVILTAGVVQSPQILELSGIGKQDVIKSTGIKHLVENERVGEGFEDHPVTILSYNLVDGEFSLDHMTRESVMQEAMQSYGLGKGGPLANGINGNGFLAVEQVASSEEKKRIEHAMQAALESARTPWEKIETKLLAERIRDPEAATFQLALLAVTTDPSRFDDQTKLLAPGLSNSRCSIIVALSHPFSRGSIHIQNNDPTAQPAIDPQYLRKRVDVEILSVGLRVADEMFRTHPLATRVHSRVFPHPSLDINDPSQREEYLRGHTGTEYHPCGTAALGQVVDEKLKVFNVQRLRVADASVIPLHVSGNIGALVYAIAEKAADLVKDDQ